jgi:hypothetical protein
MTLLERSKFRPVPPCLLALLSYGITENSMTHLMIEEGGKPTVVARMV